MLSIKFLSLVALLFANVALVSAERLTNADRLARGMHPAKPKRLYEPSRVQLAKRSPTPGTVYNSLVGISTTTIDITPPPVSSQPPKKRDVSSSEQLKREEIVARQGGVTIPIISAYLAPEPPQVPVLYAPAVGTTADPLAAVTLSYTYGQETTFSQPVPGSSNINYVSTCCVTNTSPPHCTINPADGSYVILAWTYTSSPAGAYPGSLDPNTATAFEEYCGGLESTMFTVDGLTQEVTVQYVNPTSAAYFPSGTSPIPPQEVTTSIVLYNGEFYLTGNPTATAQLLGGGELVTLYVQPE